MSDAKAQSNGTAPALDPFIQDQQQNHPTSLQGLDLNDFIQILGTKSSIRPHQSMARTPRKSSYSESEEDEPEEPTGKKAPDNDISAPVTNTSLLFSSDEEEADADQDEPKINGVGSKMATNSKPEENVEEDEDGDEPAGAVAKRTRSGSSPAENDVKTSESDSINSDSRGGGLKRKRKSPAGMKSYIQKLKEAHGVASDEEEAEVQESAGEPEEEAEAEEYSSDDNTPKSAPKKINNLSKSNGSAEEGVKPRPRSPVKNNLSPAFKNARTPQQEENEDDAEEPEEPEDEDHDVTVSSSHIKNDDSSPEPDLSVDRLKELLMKAKYLWISQEPTVFIERLDLESLTLNQDGSYDVSEFCSPYKKNVTISDDPPSQLMFTPSPSSSASAVI